MPIPATGYRPSNLTKQQRQAELAACYGVPMAEQQLTAEDYARMKQLLTKYEGEHKPATIHDLNNPPQQRYQFQKFPMMLYDHTKSQPARQELQSKRAGNTVVEEVVQVPAKLVTILVQDEKELKKALAAGWNEDAPEFSADVDEQLVNPETASRLAAQERMEAEWAGRLGRVFEGALAAHGQ